MSELGKMQLPAQRERTARKGLALAQKITHHQSVAAAVRKIAPILSPDAAETALGLLESVTNPDWKVPAVEALGAGLSDEQLPRALSVALSDMGTIYSWAIDRLPTLLSRLAAAGHEEALGNLLDEQLKLSWLDGVEGFSPLLSILTPDQLQRAWDSVLGWEQMSRRAEALAALVPHLPDTARASATHLALDALNDAMSHQPWDIDNMKRRAKALGHLIRAGDNQAGPVFQALRMYLREASARNLPLYQLFEEFGAALPPAVTDDALEAVFADHRDYFSLRGLAALAPSLNPDQALRAAKAVTKMVRFPSADSTAALTALAARLGAGQQAAILETAWEHARVARNLLAFSSNGPAELYALIPMLPPDERQTAVRIVIDHLTPSSAAWKPDRGLAAALPVLNEEEIEALYAAVTTAQSSTSRATAQSCIMGHLGRYSPQTAFAGEANLPRTWPVSLDRAAFADLIASSAWWLHREQGTPVVNEVVDALCDVCVWWP